MVMPDLGGPAFAAGAGNATDIEAQCGMSMREWYAGLAMQGFIASWPHNGAPRDVHSWAQLATKSFEAADAMVAHMAKDCEDYNADHS